MEREGIYYPSNRTLASNQQHALRRVGKPYFHSSKYPHTAVNLPPVFVRTQPQHALIQQPQEPVLAPGGGFPGLQQLLSPGLGRFPRFMWFLVLCVCTGLCLFQLFDRGSLYLREPTAVSVLVSKNDTIAFPGFTLCVGFQGFIAAITNTLLKKGVSLEGIDFTSFDKYEINLDDLWVDYALNSSALNVSVRSQMPTSYIGKIAPFSGRKNHLSTGYCNCLTFKPDDPLKLEGRTSVHFVIDHENILPKKDVKNITSNFYFRFHADDLDQKHEVMSYDDIVAIEQETALRLTIRRFSFESKRRFRCQDKVKAHGRAIQCIDDAIKQANLPCRFPFVKFKNGLEPCQNLNETKHSVYHLRDVYEQESVLKCHKKKQICKETVYTYQIAVQKPSNKKRFSTLVVFLPDNNFEMVLETFTYSFSALLSDVGGSLGFFLGVSIITLFEAIDQISRRIAKAFRL